MDAKYLRRDAGGMNTTPTIHGPGGGERVEILGNVLDIKTTAADSAGRLSVVEYDAVPGFPGPPLHVHAFDEVFYVLAGRLTFRVGDEVHEVGPGGCAYLPELVPHTFANPTDERARFLVVCAPGGFEDYFRALAACDSGAVAEVSARMGLQNVGEAVAA
jgi:mannose-6-phosphate isomerase-like protein (cupin superfamily)